MKAVGEIVAGVDPLSSLRYVFRSDVFYFYNALQWDLGALVRLPDAVRARGLEQAKRFFLRWQKGRAQVAHRLSLLGHLGRHGLRAPGGGGKLLGGNARQMPLDHVLRHEFSLSAGVMQMAASAFERSRPRKLGRVAKLRIEVMGSYLGGHERGEGSQTRSSTAAMPWPTPTHIVTSA